MGMLQPAKNRQAFFKAGIYGDAGSGKTFTSAQIAIGLHKYANLDKPVAMFDTEPAAAFVMPLFEEAGIDFMVYDQSRALADLMRFLDEAEQEASIVILDSITHVWRDTQESYLAKVNAKRQEQRRSKLYSLEFQHWRDIKAAWQKFTDRYLASKVHMIVCGRAGSIYSFQEGNNGKKELIQDGTKMATEKEMAYEPSLLVEMLRVRDGNRIINRALVEKDRANKMNGAQIDYPKFDSFRDHIDFLNIGGEHHGNMGERDSQEMFDGEEGYTGFDKEKAEREIACEEIMALFVKHGLDGTAKEAKAKRFELLEMVFGTASWKAITGMQSKALFKGKASLLDALKNQQESEA